MEFSEIGGEQKVSKVLVTEDGNLYRYDKPNSPYLIQESGRNHKKLFRAAMQKGALSVQTHGFETRGTCALCRKAIDKVIRIFT